MMEILSGMLVASSKANISVEYLTSLFPEVKRPSFHIASWAWAIMKEYLESVYIFGG